MARKKVQAETTLPIFGDFGPTPQKHEKRPSPQRKRALFVYIFVYKFRKPLIFKALCGERGIRTPGTSQYAGFQDRCIRPLCHLSIGCLRLRCSQ